MATIGNTKEFTATDGSGLTGDCLNVDTVNGIVQIPNGKTLAFYSNAYTTLTGQVKNGLYCPPSSNKATSSTVVVTSSNTISVTNAAGVNLGVVKVAASGATVTAVVLQTGTVDAQPCTLINESSNPITFAAATASNVADGASAILPALRSMAFTYDLGSSLWYHV